MIKLDQLATINYYLLFLSSSQISLTLTFLLPSRSRSSMDFFNYQNSELYVEDLPVAELAKEYGTPLYIYSRATLVRHYYAFKAGFGDRNGLVCYAVKANSNIAILQQLAQLGAGFDIVSGGELARVIAAGADPRKVIFSGVAKSHTEIAQAIEADILCFNVESKQELIRISEVAQELGKTARISLRINPNVDAKTHPYISTGLKENKFGIPAEEAVDVYLLANELPNLQITGIDCHIGSQLTNISPYREAIQELIKIIRELRQHGINIHHIDIGGGLGVTYSSEAPPLPGELLKAAYSELEELFRETGELQIIVEPGRSIVANAGILVTKVEYLKDNYAKNFAIVDAGMNDIIRPSLYGAYMNIITVDQQPEYPLVSYDVVGPVCETGCWIGKERQLRIGQGSLLAVRGAGAYCSAMSSHYNTRPKCAEVLVDGTNAHLIRRREVYSDLWHSESLLPN